jgi:hypothetical protein
MKNRPASAIIIAATLTCFLSGPGSSVASACGIRIDLPAIEQRIADPNLESDLKERANVLKTTAAAAIEAGHPEEGRKTYYQLMKLLGISGSGSGRYRFHCG